MAPDALVEDPVRVLCGLMVEAGAFAAFSKDISFPDWVGVRASGACLCGEKNQQQPWEEEEEERAQSVGTGAIGYRLQATT